MLHMGPVEGHDDGTFEEGLAFIGTTRGVTYPAGVVTLATAIPSDFFNIASTMTLPVPWPGYVLDIKFLKPHAFTNYQEPRELDEIIGNLYED